MLILGGNKKPHEGNRMRLWAKVYIFYKADITSSFKTLFNLAKCYILFYSATQSKVWSWPEWPSLTLTSKLCMTRLSSQGAKWWITTHGRNCVKEICHSFAFQFSHFNYTCVCYIQVFRCDTGWSGEHHHHPERCAGGAAEHVQCWVHSNWTQSWEWPVCA